MQKKEDIEKIIKWCEKIKEEKKKIYIIEKNPFSSEIPWTANIITIEIDKPLHLASKNSLVYNSLTKKLYQYINNTWICLNCFNSSDSKKGGNDG